MPAPADVYRSVRQAEELSSGDIAYLSLARTRLTGELPPGDKFDAAGRVPAYPRPAVLPLPHGREVAVDSMFALVVTHSCEIDRQRNANVAATHFDCRLTVAPIVSEAAVTLVNTDGSTDGVSWTAIEANIPLASLYLPPIADVSEFAPDVEPVAWPRSYADLRGLTTVSRRMVAADRLFGLTPGYLAVLQRQLTRFFTWRELARHELVESLVGRRIVGALPLETKSGRLQVALTIEVRSR